MKFRSSKIFKSYMIRIIYGKKFIKNMVYTLKELKWRLLEKLSV